MVKFCAQILRLAQVGRASLLKSVSVLEQTEKKVSRRKTRTLCGCICGIFVCLSGGHIGKPNVAVAAKTQALS